MEGTLAELATTHLVRDLRRRGRLARLGLERRRRGTVLGAALGCPWKAEAAFLLARHRSAIPRGGVARLIPVPDAGGGVPAGGAAAPPPSVGRPQRELGLPLCRTRSADDLRRPPRAAGHPGPC